MWNLSLRLTSSEIFRVLQLFTLFGYFRCSINFGLSNAVESRRDENFQTHINGDLQKYGVDFLVGGIADFIFFANRKSTLHTLSFEESGIFTLSRVWSGKVNNACHAWPRGRIAQYAPFRSYCNDCHRQQNFFTQSLNSQKLFTKNTKVMNTLLKYLPELEGDELFYLNDLLKDYNEEQVRDFAFMYRSRRRDPKIILLSTLAGFLGFAGIQRFITDQIGMGILYFFTAGLCFIGTIVDLVNYRNLAFNYNRQVAYEVVSVFNKK